MQPIIIIVLAVHGITHAYGFVREWFLAGVEEFAGRKTVSLSTRSSKLVGLLWLVVCLFFILSAFDLGLGYSQWKIIAAVSVIFSQILIILYWKDSWPGTILNVIIFSAIFLM